MKILVISTPIFKVPLRNYGGLESIAWELARGLAAKGHQVSLAAPDGSECPGVNVLFTGPERETNEHQAYDRTWKEMLKHDVVIDHSWQKYSLLLKAEGTLKAPCLCVMHAPVNTMISSLPPVENPCFVCISDDQKNHFEALFSHPARRAYNGVDLDFYRPMSVPRSRRFLFVARFSSIKGADLAIEACKKARVGLDLIGDTSITNEPEYFEKCKRMCDWGSENSGFQGWARETYGGRFSVDRKETDVVMIGPKSRSETVWWFSQAHCFLHPNQRFREPFGLAPVEAMACGCPVIAWRNGAMAETVKENETGWLVNSMQDLVGCIGAANQTEGSGPLVPITDATRKRCREWASQFSVQNMVNAYEKLCEEALSTGGW